MRSLGVIVPWSSTVTSEPSGAFFLPLLLCLPTFFRLGYCGVRENTSDNSQG